MYIYREREREIITMYVIYISENMTLIVHCNPPSRRRKRPPASWLHPDRHGWGLAETSGFGGGGVEGWGWGVGGGGGGGWGGGSPLNPKP